ncbi:MULTISPECIES: PRTRC system ThiF family protein [Deinococcus]|uniref:UBA/THIF-type NAD/FAD binding protein n=2 Tax=Deinococcus TaxID=1298 RepID=H8H2R8_DEIGI|nr:PRTRC system ThiF family protein [Deinococcus gobiensis]AFD27815.1 UBA/THIF-type NAD/FAD binding protein [Deinococcus gobiensis I-0]
MHHLQRSIRELLTDNKPLKVAVVGVGGTGSEVLIGLVRLHDALVALGYAGGLQVTAFDPDTVSPSNLVRQRYFATDLGRNKAEVLIGRINLSCGMVWRSCSQKFNSDRARKNWDIVISCVDTRKSRKELHQAAFSKGLYTWRYWLDCGNDLSNGQVILGTPGSTARDSLPCATQLHPELMDLSLPEDDTPSCSAVEALSRQDLYVGKEASLHALNLLWQLLRDKTLTDHARYFDQRQGTLGVRRCIPRPRISRRRLDSPPEPSVISTVPEASAPTPITPHTPILDAVLGVHLGTQLDTPLLREALTALLSDLTPELLAQAQAEGQTQLRPTPLGDEIAVYH